MPAGGKRPAAASPPAERARDTSADSVAATEPEIGERPALFISYSRQDVAFVRELATALHRHGKEAWVDWEDIPPTADWRHKVEAGIEASKAFAFAISPDSIASDVCRQELVHAVGAGKRIVPVVVRRVDAHDVPEPLSGPNWIFFTDGSFDVSVDTLVEALDTDLEWVDTHARILVRAVEWERHDRDRNYLLRGSDLREAETWLAEQEQHRERATALQVAYILAGRHAATRRSRQVLASVAVALVVTALLAIFAILQRNIAIANSHTARSRELATAAGAQLGVDPQLSVVLARRATEVSRTREAEDALRTALARSRQLLELRHGKWVRSAVYSHDGSRILTASDDGSAAIWDAVTGRQLHRLVGPGTSVARASFSPEGTRVVTAGDDGTVAIWDARNERRLHVLRGQRGIMHASFSPDGTHVLTCGNDRTARLWDAGTGDPLAVLRGHTTTVSTCRFSPDGRRIVTAGDDDDHVPRVWDARSATLVDVLHGHTGAIWDVRFSPDSRRIVTTSTDGSARVWEGSTLPVVLAGHSGTVWTAAFSPSGGRVATGDMGGTTRVWDARTGRRLAVIRGGNDAVTGVGFSPDGRLLVTTNGDGTVRVWNSWTGEQLLDLRGHDGWASGGTFSRDGRRVLTAGEDGTARVWDVTHGLPQIVVDIGKNAVSDLEFSRSGDSVVASSTGGTLVVRLGRTPGLVRIPGGATAAAFNPDASRVVTVGPFGLADVWDSRSGRPLEKLKRGDAMLTDTAFARDGRTVLAVGLGGTAVVWHGGDQQRATALRGDSGDLKAGAFSPDGTRVVTAGPDGALWSASSGRRLAVLRHGDTVNAAAFSPDGRTIVTAGSDGTVRLWRADGTSLAVLRGPSRPVVSASFSGDGRHVISASSDGLPRVWDVATQRSVVLRGHKGIVPTAALSPDGRFAVTGGFDGSARIFDAESGQQLERLRGPSREVLKVAFSSDGRHVAVGGLDGALRIYACGLCGSIDDLLALAAQVHRPLSVDEQVRFLHKRA